MIAHLILAYRIVSLVTLPRWGVFEIPIFPIGILHTLTYFYLKYILICVFCIPFQIRFVVFIVFSAKSYLIKYYRSFQNYNKGSGAKWLTGVTELMKYAKLRKISTKIYVGYYNYYFRGVFTMTMSMYLILQIQIFWCILHFNTHLHKCIWGSISNNCQQYFEFQYLNWSFLQESIQTINITTTDYQTKRKYTKMSKR